ncbi:MAG TPA: protein phosphatase 2C domain-containing protein [Gammaproteobacteria bacterium]|nr:protein phosphatase 2C domain-containing protein [Gammaproteobacteria bacterium]
MRNALADPSSIAGAVGDGLVFADQDMDEARTYEFVRGRAAVYTRRSPEKDTPNEDSAALVPFDEQAGVLVVADGVGGMPGGDEASRLAVESVVGAVRRAADEGAALREAILNGIEEANRAVLARSAGGATTMAIVEVDGTTIRSYHIGDSMILVTGQRGRIKQQTVSHSPVGYAVESGMLDETEAVHHAERHLVSNVIGTPDMRIEIGPHIRLAPRDTVVVASDGLFDNFYLDEIVQRVRVGRLGTAAKRLAADGRARMQQPGGDLPSKPDDMTFVLFRRSS